MIVKPYEQTATPSGMRQQAGNATERQMAHYLHRAFKDDPDAHVLNDLRLEDIEQPEQDGTVGVCQVDHLIIHRWGMFIVESKSVAEAVQVVPTAPAETSGPGLARARKSACPRRSDRQSARRSSCARSSSATIMSLSAAFPWACARSPG